MMRTYSSIVAVSLAAVSVSGCSPETGAGSATASVPASLGDEGGYTGRIRLTRFLDEPDGYCIDVPGPVFDVQLQLPVNAHTCHFGPVADQVFEYNLDAAQSLRWRYEDNDVCLTADSAETGSGFLFGACDKPEVQSFTANDKGQFNLTGSSLCIAVERTGPGYGEELAPGQDARGRGQSVNAQYTHLQRKLVLAECEGEDLSMSSWQAYEE